MVDNDVNANFLEYADVGAEPKDFDTEPPTAEEAEAAAEAAQSTTVAGKLVPVENSVEKSLEGQRTSDEFNPETLFQDETDEYHCGNFPNQTMIRPHFFSCNSPGK